jgi:hypothetical protein
MTGLEIIAEWLKEHGYDGMYSEAECGCLLTDFAPCSGDSIGSCCAGYKCKFIDEYTGKLVDGTGPIKDHVPTQEEIE